MKNKIIANFAIKIVHPILLLVTSLLYIIYTIMIALIIVLGVMPCLILPAKRTDNLYEKIANKMLKMPVKR